MRSNRQKPIHRHPVNLRLQQQWRKDGAVRPAPPAAKREQPARERQADS
jgi:hypothetical protein